MVHRSTYRGLTEAELVNPVDQARRKDLDEKFDSKLSPLASLKEFEDIGADTPMHDRYDDDIDPMPEAPEEELEPTPEAGDDYVNTQAMLPRGDSMARGKVTKRIQNIAGNLYCSVQYKPNT